MEALIIAAITGIISSVGTIAALKIEIKWLKESIEKFENRLNNHAKRIRHVEMKGNVSCQK
tara:strand:- start:599 stop:781 length:183 start_codon:yes stop_codon:yes gene_type:complete